MLPGECVGFDGATCTCGLELPLEILQSAAGYYLGYCCPQCGPYSRETIYLTEEQAITALEFVRLEGWTIYERL